MAGRRGFVIGNGESLNQTPLEEIAERYDTFAVNRIHKLYGQRPFRPRFYVRVEPHGGDEQPDEFRDECRLHVGLGEQCLFPKIWGTEWLGQHENVEYRNTCRHFSRNRVPSGWHLPMICDYGGAVQAAIQWAVAKGYDEIVLVGCDLTGGHFTKDYKGAITPDLWIKAHELAKRESPVPIINATIGGMLEVHPREDVWSYLSSR